MSVVLRGVITKTAPVVKSNITQKATLLVGPPKYVISMAEKVATGIFMAGVVVAPAAWILSHIEDYKKRD